MKSSYSPPAALVAAAAMLAIAGPANAGGLPYTGMYVFGDSLSDTGNILAASTLFPTDPYVDGRFSNGPVWVDVLASSLGLGLAPSLLGGTNYAFGGAQTGPNGATPPSLLDQGNLYLNDSGFAADSDALYVIWGGGNDVRDLGDVTNSASNISSLISDLADAGATRFLVNNLPDIGFTPEALSGQAPGGDSATLSALSIQHNQELDAQLALLAGSLPITIMTLDIYSLFADLLSNPSDYGFSNVSEACFDGLTGVGGVGNLCANPDEYVFFDGIHPTAAAHAIVGNLAYQAVIPVPAALPLLLSGLAFLGFVRRRRVA